VVGAVDFSATHTRSKDAQHMIDTSILNALMEEMRNKGSLPALSETVLEISRLARKSESSALDLATVIMRDCGLASSLLTTVNSAYYAPRFPIKTISAAVTYLGFDKVCLLSLGLGMFRHTMEALKTRRLLKLYAISYFSGALAMALAEVYEHPSPEEIFIAGLLYQLPAMSLANTFPDRFARMEALVNQDGVGVNQAYQEIFGVSYDAICDAVMASYHLPEDVEQIIDHRRQAETPLACLVAESADLAAMMFGDREGGKTALKRVERRIRTILTRDDFSVAQLIQHTFAADGNIQHFFNLTIEDVEIMVNLLAWGKTNPMAVVTHMDFGETCESDLNTDSPESLIGHFLTELALCRRRGAELNQVLMVAQEALYRCLASSEIFMAFLSQDKKVLQGRFYLGSSPHIEARDFSIPVNRTDSAIIDCLLSQAPATWQVGTKNGLGLPFAPFGKMPIAHAYLVPIIVRGQAIGLCFIGRLQGEGVDERECVWVDQVVAEVAAAFSVSRG
jgi:HD-like signal output (HDOD) protein